MLLNPERTRSGGLAGRRPPRTPLSRRSSALGPPDNRLKRVTKNTGMRVSFGRGKLWPCKLLLERAIEPFDGSSRCACGGPQVWRAARRSGCRELIMWILCNV